MSYLQSAKVRIRVSFARLHGSAWILRGASSTCLRLSDCSSCRRRIVTLMSTILVPTANHPRQGRLPFRVCEPMHFSGPPHLRAQAIVLHAGLKLCLQVVHEAYHALATRGVSGERHGNGHQTQNERELRGEHAQHACPQSLERHRRERRLLRNHALYTDPLINDLLASHVNEELLVLVRDDHRDLVHAVHVQLRVIRVCLREVDIRPPLVIKRRDCLHDRVGEKTRKPLIEGAR